LKSLLIPEFRSRGIETEAGSAESLGSHPAGKGQPSLRRNKRFSLPVVRSRTWTHYPLINSPVPTWWPRLRRSWTLQQRQRLFGSAQAAE